MQLSLVDIATGMNKVHKITDGGSQNAVITHILNSMVSFRLITRVISMKSVNFLKPFQLQTAMCYAELKYHSNDFTFMQIMAEVLNVAKDQLKRWKEEKMA